MITPAPTMTSRPKAANSLFMVRAAPGGKMGRGVLLPTATGRLAYRRQSTVAHRELAPCAPARPDPPERQTVRETVRSANDKARRRAHLQHLPARELPTGTAKNAPSVAVVACRHGRSRRRKP